MFSLFIFYLLSVIDAHSHSDIYIFLYIISIHKKDDSKELQGRIAELEQQLKEKEDEITQLKQQLASQNKDDDANKDENDANQE